MANKTRRTATCRPLARAALVGAAIVVPMTAAVPAMAVPTPVPGVVQDAYPLGGGGWVTDDRGGGGLVDGSGTDDWGAGGLVDGWGSGDWGSGGWGSGDWGSGGWGGGWGGGLFGSS